MARLTLEAIESYVKQGYSLRTMLEKYGYVKPDKPTVTRIKLS